MKSNAIGQVPPLAELYPMKVAITSATPFECQGIQQLLSTGFSNGNGSLSVNFYTTGVGIMASTYNLTHLALTQQPDLIIQAGIAGTFDNNLLLGTTIIVSHDVPGDTGVQENGRFMDVFDMGLSDADAFPFSQKKLTNPWLKKYNLLKLPEVAGVTINEITTSKLRIATLENNYAPVIESMEGASLHFVGLQTGIAFLQIRSISNIVGERNKQYWKMEEALHSLTANVLALLDRLQQVGTI